MQIVNLSSVEVAISYLGKDGKYEFINLPVDDRPLPMEDKDGEYYLVDKEVFDKCGLENVVWANPDNIHHDKFGREIGYLCLNGRTRAFTLSF